MIQQAVYESILYRIVRLKTAKEAWEYIKNEYHGSSKMVSVRIHTLRQQFELLQMREDEDVQYYVSQVVALVNKIKGLGFEIEDKEVVSKVMRSLTMKYEHVITSIEEARDMDKLSLNELSGSL